MSFSFLLGLFSFSFTSSVFALNLGHQFHRQSLLLKSQEANVLSLKLRHDGSFRDAEVSFFDQKLNHNQIGSPTFKQRFFVDSRYASSPDAPVFYIICGEWNCAGTGSYSFVEKMARKLKAHLVALEHRFYGESLPVKKLTPKALENLSLESAILDLANFQRFMMKERRLEGKWIAFGGSYAGTLAAFYRSKHPELVSGALASSAPVFMKNDFFEYDAHVASVINKTSCGESVRRAVKAIEDKLKTPEGEKEVKGIFEATNVKDNGDFLYVVADMLAAAVQYGRDKAFCDALSKSSDPVMGYAKGGLSVLTSMGTTPQELSLSIAEREEVSPSDNMRQWMWQSCQQFGWFQVANGRGVNSSRSSQINLNYHDDVCKRLYGRRMGRDGALNPEWYLPLFDSSASNIIFSNGSNDPWFTLSVFEGGRDQNPLLDLFMMEGAAHCDDLSAALKHPSVSEAQVRMEEILTRWIR